MTSDNEKNIQKMEDFLKRTSTVLNIPVDKMPTLFDEKKSILRLNTLRPDYTAIVKQLTELSKLKQITWYKNAYYIESGKSNLTKSPYFDQGYYYIQNASSLVPPLVLDPKPNEVILDMCAAPGGKTIQLAEMTNNEAFLYINDESRQRLSIMQGQLKKYGVRVLHAFNQPAQFLGKHTTQTFDAILIDAPCSSEGLVNFSNTDPLEFWNMKKIRRLSKIQKMIISEAYKLLNPGGRIVYSTCTISPEENEEVIDYILNKHNDLHTEKIEMKDIPSLPARDNWLDTIYNSEVKKAIRIIPTEYFRPFFVCILRKS